MKCALTIAGSDPIGGAGIQADIKAMASLGVHAHTVITAITSQNTFSVSSVMPVPCETILSQMDSVLSDSDVRSVKTGMLYSSEIINAVVECLSDVGVPMVSDPVMIASSGGKLASDGFLRSVKEKLLQVCDIITPNRYEAEAISGMKIDNEEDAMRACELISRNGNSVYLKGGHFESDIVTDIIYHNKEFKRLEFPRLERAGHGSGCTLSAFITANLAKGLDLMDSIVSARELMQDSIASMYVVGKGEKVVDPTASVRHDRKL